MASDIYYEPRRGVTILLAIPGVYTLESSQIERLGIVHRALDRAVGAFEPGRARAARELGDRGEPEHVAAQEQHRRIVGRASLLGDRARQRFEAP